MIRKPDEFITVRKVIESTLLANRESIDLDIISKFSSIGEQHRSTLNQVYCVIRSEDGPPDSYKDDNGNWTYGPIPYEWYLDLVVVNTTRNPNYESELAAWYENKKKENETRLAKQKAQDKLYAQLQLEKQARKPEKLKKRLARIQKRLIDENNSVSRKRLLEDELQVRNELDKLGIKI